jgi:hypothetical protein
MAGTLRPVERVRSSAEIATASAVTRLPPISTPAPSSPTGSWRAKGLRSAV